MSLLLLLLSCTRPSPTYEQIESGPIALEFLHLNDQVIAHIASRYPIPTLPITAADRPLSPTYHRGNHRLRLTEADSAFLYEWLQTSEITLIIGSTQYLFSPITHKTHPLIALDL